VYQEALTPDNAATSSRRRPAVRLRLTSGSPKSEGLVRARHDRKNSARWLSTGDFKRLRVFRDSISADMDDVISV
jgi:hypothetical protein